jgi:hypothetical protein
MSALSDQELETMFGEFINTPELDIVVCELSAGEYQDVKRVFTEVVRAHMKQE